jgi:hypothetical protein
MRIFEITKHFRREQRYAFNDQLEQIGKMLRSMISPPERFSTSPCRASFKRRLACPIERAIRKAGGVPR